MKSVLIIFLLMLSPNFVSAQQVALVIGNSDYVSVAALDNPRNDSAAISQALTSQGFRVITADNLGRSAMYNALREFRDLADKADVALVYYAGHGMEIAGVNYLVPVDARLSDERDARVEMIEVGDILAQISGARALKMVVLDACRNNPFVAQMTRGNAGRNVGRGLSALNTDEADVLIAYAAAAGAITPDGEAGGNSPFSAAFVKALQGPPLDVRRLLGSVRDEMRRSVPGAAPFVYTSLGGGEFVINPKSQPVGPPAETVLPPASDDSSIGTDFAIAMNQSSIEAWDGFLLKHKARQDHSVYKLAMSMKSSLLPQVQKPETQPDTKPISPEAQTWAERRLTEMRQAQQLGNVKGSRGFTMSKPLMYLTFWAVSATIYDIQVASANGGKVEAYLEDEAGQVVEKFKNIGLKGADLHFGNVTGRRLYIRIEQPDGDPPIGDIKVSLQSSKTKNAISSVVQPPQTPTERAQAERQRAVRLTPTLTSVVQKSDTTSQRQKYYKFSAAEGLTYEIRLNSTDFSELALYVENEAGRLLSYSAKPNKISQWIRITAEKTETLYIRIGRAANDTSTSYFTLSINTTKPLVAVSAAVPKAQTWIELRQAAKQQAQQIFPYSTPRINSTDSLSQQLKYYSFQAQQGTIYDIGLDSKNGSDVDLFLEDEAGNVLAKSVNTGKESERIHYTADAAKKLYLRAERVGSNVSSGMIAVSGRAYQLTTKGKSWTDSSRLIETVKDWEIRRSGDECIARTLATKVVPESGWRNFLPYFLVSVRPGASTVGSELDNMTIEKLSYRDKKAKAHILIGSAWQVRNLYMTEKWLRPLTSDLKFIDSNTVGKFRAGKQMYVEGTSDDAEPINFEIHYSLDGYTAAIKRMNALCNAKVLWMLGN